MSEAERAKAATLAKVRASLPSEGGGPSLAEGVAAAQATARARAAAKAEAEAPEGSEPVLGGLAAAVAAERAADAAEAAGVASSLPEPTRPEEMDADTLADDLAAEAAADLLGADGQIEGAAPSRPDRVDYRKLAAAVQAVLLETAPDFFSAKMALTAAMRDLGRKWTEKQRRDRQAQFDKAIFQQMTAEYQKEVSN